MPFFIQVEIQIFGKKENNETLKYSHLLLL